MAFRKGPNAGATWRSRYWDEDEAYFVLPESATPGPADAGTIRLYARDDGGGLAVIDDTGREFSIMIASSSSDQLSDLVRLITRQNVLLNAINTALGKMGPEHVNPDDVAEQEVN